MKAYETNEGLECFYEGPDIKEGPLPAFIYFALSAEDSLTLAPYNAPITFLKDLPLRLFSISVPAHEKAQDKFLAMNRWAEEMRTGSPLIEEFIRKSARVVSTLIDSQIIDPSKIAAGGLSRGAFIATHLAAHEKRITSLIGFAPLTRLQEVMEFKPFLENASFNAKLETLNLIQLVDHLTHLKKLRFYIGNHDTRVSTEACFQFIKSMAEKMDQIRNRESEIELFITSSIGHKGHGTAPATFKEGALWIKKQLLENL